MKFASYNLQTCDWYCVYYLLFDSKLEKILWKNCWIAPYFPPKSFWYSTRNLDVKLLSILLTQGKKYVNLNDSCHYGKNGIGLYLLGFRNVEPFLLKVHSKHGFIGYLLIKWKSFKVKHSSNLFVWLIKDGSLCFPMTRQQEVFTFHILLDRLPLPEQTFMGHWTIGQSRNGTEKLLCPAETHHIDIKVDLITSSLNYWTLQIFLFSLARLLTILEMACSDVVLE